MRRSDKKESSAPKTWTTKRWIVFGFLCVHWFCVLVWAIPEYGQRMPLLRVGATLPSLNTHAGEFGVDFRYRSIIQTYLISSAQYQKWRMFIPRRPNVAYLALDTEGEDGRITRTLISEQMMRGHFRQLRWRLLESALLNPDRREDYLPRAARRIAELLGDENARSVEAVKLAYPIPLLKPDGTGNPLFTTAGAFRNVLDKREAFIEISMGKYALQDDTLP